MPCGVGAWEMLMMRDVIAAPGIAQLNKGIDVQRLHIYTFVQLRNRIEGARHTRIFQK